LSTGETKERLVAVAVERFQANGLDGVSLRDVAKRAGVTPMAVYRHFADKKALLLTVIERGFAIYADYLASPGAPDEPLERLRWLAGRVFDFAQEQGAYFELMFLTSRTARGLEDRSEVRTIHVPTFKIAREALSGAGYAPKPGRGSLTQATTDMLAYCIGMCAFFISGALPADDDLGRTAFLDGFDRQLCRLLDRSQIHNDTGEER
jgi:AcrR family transcriptional regulator